MVKKMYIYIHIYIYLFIYIYGLYRWVSFLCFFLDGFINFYVYITSWLRNVKNRWLMIIMSISNWGKEWGFKQLYILSGYD